MDMDGLLRSMNVSKTFEVDVCHHTIFLKHMEARAMNDATGTCATQNTCGSPLLDF